MINVRLLLLLICFFLGGMSKMNTTQPLAVATFAGGCFWCMQPAFDALDGVNLTTVGYSGGHLLNPTYKDVTSGASGHSESIQVEYNPNIVNYVTLLNTFWQQIDPTQKDGQFADIGSHYEAVIFYHTDEQHQSALESKKKLGLSGKFSKPIVTAIKPSAPFYAAEDYHQKYYQKQRMHYQLYKKGSGRADFIEKNWR